MPKDKDEALRALDEALQEPAQREPDELDRLVEEFLAEPMEPPKPPLYRNFSNGYGGTPPPVRDADADIYSDEPETAPRSNNLVKLAIFSVILTTAIVAMVAWWFIYHG